MTTRKITMENISTLVESVIKEYTDSLGQTHGSPAFDQDGNFAKIIFAAMRAIDEKLGDDNPEEIDDYNEQQAYLALKRAYNALYDLIHLQASDY